MNYPINQATNKYYKAVSSACSESQKLINNASAAAFDAGLATARENVKLEFEQRDKEIAELKAQAERLMCDRAALRQDIAEFKAQLIARDSGLETLKKDISFLETAIAKKEADRAEARGFIDDIAKALHPHWRDGDRHTFVPGQLAGKVEELKGELAAWKKTFAGDPGAPPKSCSSVCTDTDENGRLNSDGSKLWSEKPNNVFHCVHKDYAHSTPWPWDKLCVRKRDGGERGIIFRLDVKTKGDVVVLDQCQVDVLVEWLAENA